MKAANNLLMAISLLLSSCKNSTTDNRITYIESKPTFFELRSGEWLKNKWIRESKNISMIHETVKKIGYPKIINKYLLLDNPTILQDIFIQKQANRLLDSLELSYSQPYLTDSYYAKFWQRRKAEKNDTIAYQIIREVNYSFKHDSAVAELAMNVNDELVNDTLLSLLQIELQSDSLTEEIALNNFQTLKRLGFHQSAYNLLFETYQYQDLKWNRDSLAATLTSSNKFVSAWFQDNTK